MSHAQAPRRVFGAGIVDFARQSLHVHVYVLKPDERQKPTKLQTNHLNVASLPYQMNLPCS